MADDNQPTAASVSRGPSGRLVYTANGAGDTVPDFAHVGFKDDLEEWPAADSVPTLQLVVPEDGISDDGPRIQAAIDAVAAQPVDDATGFRGAVTLAAGAFVIGTPLRINTSGVVLRGAGAAGGGTELLATFTSQQTVIQVAGDDDLAESGASTVVTDAYVPVGSFTLNVSSTEGMWVGGLVVVRRPGTAAWISSIGMDAIRDCTPPLPGRACTQWSPSTYDFAFERVLVGIDGTTLTFDAPLVQSIDARYGGATVSAATERRISHIGIEDLRINSTFDPSITACCDYSGETYFSDDEHAWTAVAFAHTAHAWAARINCTHLVFACVHVQSSAKHGALAAPSSACCAPSTNATRTHATGTRTHATGTRTTHATGTRTHATGTRTHATGTRTHARCPHAPCSLASPRQH